MPAQAEYSIRALALCNPTPISLSAFSAASQAADGNTLLHQCPQSRSILWLYLAKLNCSASSVDCAHHNRSSLQDKLHLLGKFPLVLPFLQHCWISLQRWGKAGGGSSENTTAHIHSSQTRKELQVMRAPLGYSTLKRHFEE